jgi:hypothetical protein
MMVPRPDNKQSKQMTNPFPTNGGEIYNLATKNYDGIVAIGAAIPVTMVTAPQFLTSKTAFMNAETAFNTARNTQRNAYLVFKPAVSALYDWEIGARAVLTLQLGDQWSAAWAEAGFVAPTTAVPDTTEGQIALGRSLATYFTDHPSAERPDDDVTAAKATELTDAAFAGQNGVATAKQTLRNADGARRPARKDLLYLMSTLVSNLNKKLAANDPRWLAFGLQMPSTPTTPAAPENVTAMLTEDGAIIVQCDPAALATRYRGRMLIVGVETKYQLVFSGPEPMGRIPGVQPGVTVQIIMQAVNGSSQSMPSEPVLFTMPLAAKPETLLTEMAPLAAITPNGNGSGNNNGVALTATRN